MESPEPLGFAVIADIGTLQCWEGNTRAWAGLTFRVLAFGLYQ